ncbi:DUF732 domain-containing protein [Mycobacterium sp. HUMS_1102779]|uniref:DUF732 domain-containing protein n=1 Tax=Mycobacterium sp. HUMS_1102779 TaxID=3383487 RepID=UPI00389ABFA3
MRDRETIDSELRLLALGRRSIREQGGQPSTQRVDELLDERLGHLPAAPGGVIAPAGPVGRRRKSALRRFGPLAVLPLSLLAVVAAVVVILAGREAPPAAEPAETTPRTAPPAPAMPTKAPASTSGIADKALTDALQQQGVPVPGRDYVATQGHAVCEFLKNRADFADAVRFVQRSSIWDADQSTAVTAGAIVSYCPQFHPASLGETQPGLDKALSDLQAIEGKLQGIQGDLQGIEGDLQALPGHR